MSWSATISRAVVILSVCLALGANDAKATSTIPPVYVVTAEVHAIPPLLFYAIAMQESGRYDERVKRLRPWPWSLNVAGEAHYFENMDTAWDALRGFISKKPANIGIGLVQVTWPYNRHILQDPYTALEPTINLALGAQILRACFDRLDDWWLAVGCYHSPTPKHADAYRERVRRHWMTLIEKAGA